MTTWPDIPYARWRPTGASLHMWSQIVGKFRLALTPWMNHSWHAVLYLTPRGLTTSTIPGADAQYEVRFDFIDHHLTIDVSNGQSAILPLEPMPVADFNKAFRAALKGLGAPTKFDALPNEVPAPKAFREQGEPGAYDPEAARDFHLAALAIDTVFKRFRTGFLGKSSPSHLFWGSRRPSIRAASPRYQTTSRARPIPTKYRRRAFGRGAAASMSPASTLMLIRPLMGLRTQMLSPPLPIGPTP